jgi:hypothetical protein
MVIRMDGIDRARAPRASAGRGVLQKNESTEPVEDTKAFLEMFADALQFDD